MTHEPGHELDPEELTAEDLGEDLTGSDLLSILDSAIASVGGASADEQQLPSFPGIAPEAIVAGPGGQPSVPSPGGTTDPVFRDGLLVAGGPAGTRELKWEEADVWAPMARSGAEIQQLQDQLVTAGLLARGGYVPGIWDKPSQEAQRQLLGFSNLSGREPDTLLVQLSGLVESERQKMRNESVRRATAGFVRQDPATVQSTVKSAVKNLIRRDPTDQEMAEFTAHWRQFEQQDLGQMQQQAAGQAEFEAGLIDDLPPVTDVNPEARLEEFLAQRFAGTITQNQRVDEMQNGQHNILRMIDRTAGLMSGG